MRALLCLILEKPTKWNIEHHLHFISNVAASFLLKIKSFTSVWKPTERPRAYHSYINYILYSDIDISSSKLLFLIELNQSVLCEFERPGNIDRVNL